MLTLPDTAPEAWDSPLWTPPGHPWSATGGRILTTAANELARRDGRYALISICAAGAMAGAFLLAR